MRLDLVDGVDLDLVQFAAARNLAALVIHSVLLSFMIGAAAE